MAITKVSRSLLNTGVSDGSDATAITIDSSEKVGIGVSSNLNANLHVGSSNATGDSTNPAIQIGGSSSGNTFRLGFYTSTEGGVIENKNGDDGIQFRVKTAGEAMRIDGGTGKVGIGESAPSNAKLEILQAGDHDAHSTHGIAIHSTGNTNFTSMYMGCEDGIDSAYIQSVALDGSFTSKSLLLNPNGGKVFIGGTTSSFNARLTLERDGYSIESRSSGTGSEGHVVFRNGNGAVGSIFTNASATAYNTSSDYRLKENVDYTWDATTRLKQLKPARFNFKSDETNTLVDGFLAHEVSSIVPEAITGEKDAVDSEGNPEYQGIDQSKLVPLLVKTIQELEARITTLEG